MIKVALPSKELKRLKLLLEFIDTSILCKILNDNINKKNVMGIFLNKVSSLYISEELNKVIIDSDVVDSNVSKTTARMYIAVLESIREALDTHTLSDSLFIIGGTNQSTAPIDLQTLTEFMQKLKKKYIGTLLPVKLGYGKTSWYTCRGLIVIFAKTPPHKDIHINNLVGDDDIDEIIKNGSREVIYTMNKLDFSFDHLVRGYVPVMVSTISKNHLEYQDAMDILRNDGVYTDKAIIFAHNICKMNVAGALDYKTYRGGNKDDKGI